jgi:hypothetical protein
MINAKLQSIIDTKSAIGNAIVNKGGTVTGSTPFFNYASEINNISTGTPQTVFQDSTGAKWARTNAVNLTNVSNNVTSDFNWWQPANNTTSDSIMTVGTVGANISGNIRLVPVNQVNIAQYANIVAQADNGAKFVGYNGYDKQTNPTPSGNTTFNRWLLNNSASGTVVFANATFVNNGTFNGPNSIDSSLLLESRVLSYPSHPSSSSGWCNNLTVINGFLFSAGEQGFMNRVIRYNTTTMDWTHTSGNISTLWSGTPYSGITAITSDPSNQIYIAMNSATTNSVGVRVLRDTDLALLSSSITYISRFSNNILWIRGLTSFNSFLFASYASGGFLTRQLISSPYTQFELQTNSWPIDLKTADNNLYVLSASPNNHSNNGVIKYSSTFARLAETSYPSGLYPRKFVIANNFVYTSGSPGDGVPIRKYHAANLSFIASSFVGEFSEIQADANFVYAFKYGTGPVYKMFASNLALVKTETYSGWTAPLGWAGLSATALANNRFYTAGLIGSTDVNNNTTLKTIGKFYADAISSEIVTTFTINKIKENI